MTVQTWKVWLLDLEGGSEPELAYEAESFNEAAAFVRQWLEEPFGLVAAIERKETAPRFGDTT